MTVSPGYIRHPPWVPFSFTCIAPEGQKPSILFTKDKRPVVHDPRFNIQYINDNTIEVTTPRGLRGDEEMLLLEYVFHLFLYDSRNSSNNGVHLTIQLDA